MGTIRRASTVAAIALYCVVGAFIYHAWWSARATSSSTAEDRTIAETRIKYDHYTYLGLRYYEMRNFRKAEWAFRKGIEHAPDRPLAYNNLGSALNAQERWDEAISVLEHALALDPDLAIARRNLAWAKGEQSKHAR